jgi:hypothetical protein
MEGVNIDQATYIDLFNIQESIYEGFRSDDIWNSHQNISRMENSFSRLLRIFFCFLLIFAPELMRFPLVQSNF